MPDFIKFHFNNNPALKDNWKKCPIGNYMVLPCGCKRYIPAFHKDEKCDKCKQFGGFKTSKDINHNNEMITVHQFQWAAEMELAKIVREHNIPIEHEYSWYDGTICWRIKDDITTASDLIVEHLNDLLRNSYWKLIAVHYFQ